MTHFITMQARKRGLPVRRIKHLYANRTVRLIKTALFVGGLRCHLHHLTGSRKDHRRHYSFLGVFRSTLQTSDFTVVLCKLHDGSEQLFIIPNEVLLSQFPEGTRFKRFYVPQEFSSAQWRQQHNRFDWSHYKDAWHLLSQESARKSTSVFD